MLVSCLALLSWARPTNATTEERGRAALMPKQCRPGKTSTVVLGWRWKPNAHVRLYYLKGNFSGTERDALNRAVHNWNEGLKQIDSRVVFTIGGEHETVAEDNASITVMRGIPKGKDRLGEIKFYSMSNGVERMTVTISPVVTDLNALTSLMAHEIGHSLGLADCYGCRRGTTTMAAFKDDNKGNDVYEPSECDKYVVAAGYASETGAQARAVLTEHK
jgi:hypothetical protein